MKKKFIIFLASGLLTFSCLSLVGCNSSDVSQKETFVFVTDNGFGSVETKQTDLVAGEVEQITVIPNTGYVVEKITANDQDATKVDDTHFTYTVNKGYNFINVIFKAGSAGDIGGDDPVDVPDGTLSNNTKIAGSRGSQGTLDSYYAPCKGLKGKALKDALHDIIKGHKGYGYSSLHSTMLITDIDPFDSSKLVITYEGSLPKGTSFNKEHTWAKSHGEFGTSIPSGTDMHPLRPCDSGLNSTRSNFDFGDVADHSNATDCSLNSKWGRASMKGNYLGTGKTIGAKVFEPKNDFKGDVARMIFYMAVRYEGTDGEKDLEVNGKIPSNFYDFTPANNGLHGNFIDLYTWSMSGIDPVSDFEMNRNNLIDQKYQHNRNPYIDHPEFLEMIYSKDYTGPGALM
jgi:endonuclease I